jgi:hypothetical protein
MHVKTALGKCVPVSVKTWDEWSRYTNNTSEFQWDDKVQNEIQEMRALIEKDRSVVRLVGHSGLGKTRFAFEAFRPPSESAPDDTLQALSDHVCYIDAASINNGILLQFIDVCLKNEISATLVVDNCEPALHHLLQKEVTRTDTYAQRT